RRHTRFSRDWSSDVCSSDLVLTVGLFLGGQAFLGRFSTWANPAVFILVVIAVILAVINAGGFGEVMAVRVVDSAVTPLVFITCRSEERRVGKECSSRRSRSR